MNRITLFLFCLLGLILMLACNPVVITPKGPIPTPIPTITYSPTITFTPTITLTPTVTFTPTSTPTPISPSLLNCSTDNTTGVPSSGAITFTGSGGCPSFIPLCDGWVLVADGWAYQIKLVNIFTGTVNHVFQLNNPATQMAYDPSTSTLYAGIGWSLAKINLLTYAISYFSLPGSVIALAQGPPNKLFIGVIGNSSNFEVVLLDTSSGNVFTTFSTINPWSLIYDSANSQLIIAQDVVPVVLQSWKFNNSTDALTAGQSVTLTVTFGGLNVSPDGGHLAFLPLTQTSTLDQDPNNLGNNLGQWAAGLSPQGGVFTLNSQSFLSTVGPSPPIALNLYSTSTYTLSKTYASNLGLSSVSQIGFSPGGGIIYVSSSDIVMNWYLYP